MRLTRFITIFLIVLIPVNILIYKRDYILSLIMDDPLFSRLKNKSILIESKVVSLNTDTPIDKWKTYINEKYKYSIKYRPEFQIREFEDKSWVTIDNVKKDMLPEEKDWFMIIIKILPNDSSLSPGEYLKLYARSYPNCRAKILDSFIEYKNNDIDGIKGNVDPCSNLENITVIFTNKDYAFVIELGSDNSFNPPFTETKLRLFDQILSTFKFTD